MDDEKLKQELFYMVRLTSKYDFSKMQVVEGILRLENERRILVSVFGRRFKTRIFDIAAEVAHDGNCVICGQPAENQVICNHCMETIMASEYAQARIKPEKKKFKIDLSFLAGIKSRLKERLKTLTIKKNVSEEPEEATSSEVNASVSKKINIKSILAYMAAAFLVLILCFQLWILKLWIAIPDYNPKEEPQVSAYDLTPVANEEEAKAQLALDFPEEEGYTITYGRKDNDYTGRFLIDKGACCEEIEESLTDDQRYDYFFTDEVYVFYISMNTETVAKVGLAEVNPDGAIVVMGSFNDGRDTNSRYRFR
ncbi:hypothetical protein SAMN02910298_00683 [Pseudobutyrivibrio sp. YE44]|uniref:hypothetical protein n=1 Tax=Pseudobutyrivibrio sp. YE44 TaxID=1520802 RepID=UPI000891EA30|nr:hypothetical protein [Pseudobutyrivibrio sp. YE44]SDB13147.1 hypothetical protein SAMN02910298_00683 [Pseudobutyrivibrio sp. YE44]